MRLEMIHPPLRLRLMTRGDLPFADSVRFLAGWNQTPADWERFLATEPDGCFLAEWNGAPAGTGPGGADGLPPLGGHPLRWIRRKCLTHFRLSGGSRFAGALVGKAAELL